MTLATLKQRTGTFKHIVAGHGEIYSANERAHQAIDYMVQRLESILDAANNTRREERHKLLPRKIQGRCSKRMTSPWGVFSPTLKS